MQTGEQAGVTQYRQDSCRGVNYLMRPGSGAPLVFLHGIGSNAASFTPLFDALPDGQSLLAWNAPGYAGSDPLPQPWPVAADYAFRLREVLDDLALDQVHLVGHSLGTLIAAAFARHNPERLLSLTLAASATGYQIPPGGELPAKLAARITDLARLGPAGLARARAANLVHDPKAHPSVVARVEAAMARITPTGYGQAVRLLASGDLAADLEQVPLCPGFLIGAQDRVTPMAQTRTAAEAWHRAHGRPPPITEIAGAGHAVYVQQPDATATALLDQLPAPLLATARQQKGH